MKPRSHNYGGGTRNATANIGGKEVNITINLGGEKAMGPVHLASDGNMPDGVVHARTGKDIELAQSNAAAQLEFSNPAQNVRRIGLKEGMKVADFGSGSGRYTLEIADVVGETGKVYAVDVQRDLLTKVQNDATQKKFENVEIVWADMEQSGSVAIKDTYLDAVVLSNTLFQFDDKITPVKEAWRVLKPGGLLAVIDWSDSFNGMGPPQHAVVTQPESMLLCTDNGFAFKNEFSAGDHHYGLVFVKMLDGQDQQSVVDASRQQEEDFIQKTINQELI